MNLISTHMCAHARMLDLLLIPYYLGSNPACVQRGYASSAVGRPTLKLGVTRICITRLLKDFS